MTGMAGPGQTWQCFGEECGLMKEGCCILWCSAGDVGREEGGEGRRRR